MCSSKIKLATPLEEQLLCFMPHNNGETNYRKIKIGDFIMNNNFSSK
jgi:hypothetical protein